MATTDELLAAIKDSAFWPETNAPLSDAQILRVANREIQGEAYPLLLKVDGDYYLSTERHDLTAGQKSYRLPRRAFGPIRDVLYLADGAESDDEAESLPKTTVEAAGHMVVRGRSQSAWWPQRSPWYIEGDHLVLCSTPTETRGELLVKYRRRPSTLVVATDARQVVMIGNGLTANQIGVDSILTWVIDSFFDVINHRNAHHVLWEGARLTAIAQPGATTLTFDSAVPTTLAARYPNGILAPLVIDSDWVTLAGTTPLVPVPDEAIAWLTQQVTVRALEIAGDEAGLARALRTLKSLRESLEDGIAERADAEPRYVAPRNAPIRLLRGY